jgi:PAS domain-containing protein
MPWRFTPYVIPEVISVAVAIWLIITLWRRRSAPGAVPFILLLLGLVVWSLGYALELGSVGLPTVLFWDNVAWLGKLLMPPIWFVFALQYTGRGRWLTRRRVVFLAIVQFVNLLLIWTNGMHGLIYTSSRLDSSAPFSALVFTHNVGYWAIVVYNYLFLLLGTLLIGLFIRTLMRSAFLYRGQVGALLICVLAPWAANILFNFGLGPVPHFDLTASAFTITALAIAWSLFRFRMLDLVPVARSAVIESMSDAMIVLDQHHRITDLNPAAQRLFGHPLSELVGQPARVSHWSPDCLARYH